VHPTPRPSYQLELSRQVLDFTIFRFSHSLLTETAPKKGKNRPVPQTSSGITESQTRANKARQIVSCLPSCTMPGTSPANSIDHDSANLPNVDSQTRSKMAKYICCPALFQGQVQPTQSAKFHRVNKTYKQVQTCQCIVSCLLPCTCLEQVQTSQLGMICMSCNVFVGDG
jgi:hypothetical protein